MKMLLFPSLSKTFLSKGTERCSYAFLPKLPIILPNVS